MKRRLAVEVAACLVVASAATKAAAIEVGEHGDFGSLGIDYALRGWWWAVAALAVLLLALPAVFWKRRRGYVSMLSLALAVLSAWEWNRSFRGKELVSVLSWRDGTDGAVYEDMRQVSSSAGGIGVLYRVICYHRKRRGSTHAVTAAELAEGPNPRFVFSRASLIAYPGFRPETSFGLFPYQGTTNPGVKTLAVQVWSQPADVNSGVKPVVFDGIVAPYWFLIVVLCIPPLLWILRAWRLGRRRANARCVKCGYDLRASEGRCPECGTPIPQKGGSAAESGAIPSTEGVHRPVSD